MCFSSTKTKPSKYIETPAFMAKLTMWILNKFLPEDIRQILKAALISYSDAMFQIRSETCKDIGAQASRLAILIKTKPYNRDEVFPIRCIDHYTSVFRENLVKDLQKDISNKISKITKQEKELFNIGLELKWSNQTWE